MGQERPTCPNCGAPLVFALPFDGKGKRKLQCLDCDWPDPMKTERVTGWLKSELQPPTQGAAWGGIRTRPGVPRSPGLVTGTPLGRSLQRHEMKEAARLRRPSAFSLI